MLLHELVEATVGADNFTELVEVLTGSEEDQESRYCEQNDKRSSTHHGYLFPIELPGGRTEGWWGSCGAARTHIRSKILGYYAGQTVRFSKQLLQ